VGIKFVFAFFVIIFLTFRVVPVEAVGSVSVAESSAALRSETIDEPVAFIQDLRVKKIETYISGRKAPLADYAEVFINTADRYGIDWRLVAAIAGVESNFGKHIPARSYNAWGWDNGRYKFSSWEMGIDHVSKVLNEKYYTRGLTNPRLIGPVYAPPSKSWSANVEYFIRELDEVKIPTADRLALGF
jgi:hypothetical protein